MRLSHAILYASAIGKKEMSFADIGRFDSMRKSIVIQKLVSPYKLEDSDKTSVYALCNAKLCITKKQN